MTVQNTAVKNIYIGNGSTTEYPITFEVNEAHPEYIHVYTGAAEASSIETTNFEVDLITKKVTYPKTGEPLASGLKLIITRELPLTQSLNLINQGDYFATDVEQAFDDNVMMLQQLNERLSRAVLMDIGVDGNSFDATLKLIPGKAIKINDEGTGFDLTEDPAKVITIVQNLLQQTKQQANIATEQAGIATNKANAAAESAVSAATSETNAADSEDKAQAWAESEKSPDGEADSKSSKTWAEEAAQSASNAATSETNAANSATSATGSASEAASSASTATKQAGIATDKAEEAASSAASALDSKNAAATSAGNAATSEENAATSEENAASSATAASNSASAAAASAQEAADTAAGLGNPVMEVTESNGTVTVKKADNSTNTFQTFTLDKAYPVGSIYMSVNSANPSTFFGGTWEAFGQGRVLIGAGEGTDANSVKKTFTGGATGGEYEHKLTTAEMPSHNHTASTDSTGSHTHTGTATTTGNHTHTITALSASATQYSDSEGKKSLGDSNTLTTSSKGSHTHSVTIQSGGAHQHTVTVDNAGSGASHNNLPPYIGVYFWRRTA